LTNGGVLAADAQTTLPNFPSPPVCVPSSKPPNIVLIHQESIFPLNIFPQIQYDHDLDRFFYSDDDQLHKMRVETFGGGSWITEFSVMSGISTRSFGDMGRFLHIFMRGHLHEALPQWLEKCGYRNVVFFPLDRTMFSLDKFYDSIGLHEVVDRDALKATDRERDRFFFDNAMVTMAQHFKSSDKPIFVYIQTMTAHGLWDQPFLPDEPVAKGGAGNSAEMNEYLRRVAIAAKDGEYFVDALKRRFPEERFLIVRFGDHQPELTRKLVNASTETATKGTVDADRTPNAYLTYYSVLGVNYPVPPLPEYDVLDVAFLQTVLLDAAGLPLTPAQQERDRLMAVCAGQYFGCKQSDAIPAFHRRLINSGIVTP
jgi:phosphoglycerol transferase MdoB-like AlkP superfamily enzyme